MNSNDEIPEEFKRYRYLYTALKKTFSYQYKEAQKFIERMRDEDNKKPDEILAFLLCMGTCVKSTQPANETFLNMVNYAMCGCGYYRDKGMPSVHEHCKFSNILNRRIVATFSMMVISTAIALLSLFYFKDTEMFFGVAFAAGCMITSLLCHIDTLILNKRCMKPDD